MEAFGMAASDGTPLGGFVWDGHGETGGRPVVVIAPATSVRCRYYARFADFLSGHGFAVVTFDYRGIGLSRPAKMRGFEAGWVDWGEQDLDAAIRFAAGRFPGRPIDVVAHSIGGFAIGLAPSARLVRRIFTVGSQYGYWRDYPGAARARMVLKWHVAMPLLTGLFGYFPGKRLGWMEDTPAGVALDWARMRARAEDRLRPPRHAGLAQAFGTVAAPILAVSLTDDPHGTAAAVERLLAYYTASRTAHVRIAPAEIGHERIGHFAFFHDRFKDSLWPLALVWLKTGQAAAVRERLARCAPTTAVSRMPGTPLPALPADGDLAGTIRSPGAGRTS